MADKFVLAFLLDKKKNQATNLPFLFIEVTNQLRVAYPPSQVGDRKDRIAEEISFY